MAESTAHTVKAFDEDLRQIRALVAEMGGCAEKAIADAVQSLSDRNLEMAQRVIDSDKRIDEVEAEIERQVVRLIALRAPMADDLREVIAALKISSMIERIGDYAKNIAKRVPLVAEGRTIEPTSIIPAMGAATIKMLKSVLDAYAARDADAAVVVAESDAAVDNLYNSLFRTLLTYMMENPHNITSSTHLLFIAKNLERIGDHATNVAETVYQEATGRPMPERTKGAGLYTPGVK